MDLPVQFPWPIGTNGAEKLGLASRSGGRPTSYWAGSLKGVMSWIVAAEVQEPGARTTALVARPISVGTAERGSQCPKDHQHEC